MRLAVARCEVSLDLVQITTLHYWGISLISSSAPGPVASVSGSPSSATSVALSWAPPLTTNGMLTSYHIDYQSASGSGIHDNEGVNLPVSTTSYTVTGLEENTLYHFTVSAETGAGRGEGSTVSVRTSIDRESL